MDFSLIFNQCARRESSVASVGASRRDDASVARQFGARWSAEAKQINSTARLRREIIRCGAASRA